MSRKVILSDEEKLERRKIYHKRYYERNKEKVRERNKKYFAKYYQEHKEEMKKKTCDYIKDNPEKV